MANDMENINFKLNVKGASSVTDTFKKISSTITSALAPASAETQKLKTQFDKATAAVERQSQKVDELKAKLDGLKSGEIVPKDAGFTKLNKELEKTLNEIDKLKAKEAELKAETEKVKAEYSIMTPKGIFTPATAELEKLEQKLHGVQTELATARAKANILSPAVEEAHGAAVQANISNTETKLKQEGARLDELKQKATATGKALSTSMNPLSRAIHNVSEGISNFGSRIFGLAKRVFVFTLITKGLRALRDTFGAALQSNSQFQGAVEQLRVSLYMLAVPIYQTVLPGLIRFIQMLAKVIQAIAVFTYALMGKSRKELVQNAKKLREQVKAYNASNKANKKYNKGVKDTTKNLKEANKQLASFDELLVLQQKQQQGIDDINEGAVGADGGTTPELEIPEIGDGGNDNPLLDIAERVGNWIRENKAILGVVAGLILLGAIIKAVLGWFGKKDKGLDKQTKKTGKEEDAVKDLSTAFENALAPLLGFAGAGAAVGAAAGAAEGELDGLKVGAENGAVALGGLGDSAWSTSPAANVLANAVEALSLGMESLNETTSQTAPVIDAARLAAESMSASAVATQVSVGDLNTSTSDLNTSTGDLGGAYSNLYDTLSNVQEQLQTLTQTTQPSVVSNNDTIIQSVKDLATEVSNSSVATRDTVKETLREHNDAYNQSKAAIEEFKNQTIQAWEDSKTKANDTAPIIEDKLTSINKKHEDLITNIPKSKDELSKFYETGKDKTNNEGKIINDGFDTTKDKVDTVKDKVAAAKTGFAQFFEDTKTNAETNMPTAFDEIINFGNIVSTAFNYANDSLIEFVPVFTSNIKTGFSNVSKNAWESAESMRKAWATKLKAMAGDFQTVQKKGGKIMPRDFDSSKQSAETGLTIGAVGAAALTLLAIVALSPVGLATGTVVPPNKPFMAMLGDNKNEPEVVSPISTMRQAIREEMQAMGYSRNNAPTEVILQVSGREFGRAVLELGDKAKRIKGNSFIKTKLIYG